MKIDTTAHVRVTPLTDCGCRPAGEPIVNTDVPVYLVDEPQIVDGVATTYTIELSINSMPASTLPPHAMVETWIRTTGHTCDEDAVTQWASVALRHLVDGVTAQPWAPCPDHGGVPGDTGPAVAITLNWGSNPIPGWN